LLVVNESLRQLAGTLETPEALHGFVGSVELSAVLTFVSETGGTLAFLRRRYVHVMGRSKVLRLLAGRDFIVVQGELPAGSQPGVVDQQRADAVVPMGVDGPLLSGNQRPAHNRTAHRTPATEPLVNLGRQGSLLFEGANGLDLRVRDVSHRNPSGWRFHSTGDQAKDSISHLRQVAQVFKAEAII
jgi:hypothetical protein